MVTRIIDLDEIRDRIAKNLSERRVGEGPGQLGTVIVAQRRNVTRTFKAHWTGFKIFYPGSCVLLRADLTDASFWSEAYIAAERPCWVLSFRKTPPKARGSGGPRPDDKFTSAQHVDQALEHRRRMIETGLAADEELIRMEDFDDPIEAIDAFFNYTTFYVLKSIEATWDQLGYVPDPSIGWKKDEEAAAALPIDTAIDEGLKKSDIIWLTPNTAPDRPIPCWFVYKDGRAFVLSGERQQVIPQAHRVRDVHVVTRWKGRDVRLVDFDAGIRQIAGDDPEFDEIAQLLINKRQSVTGSIDEIIERYRRECVILELIPRV